MHEVGFIAMNPSSEMSSKIDAAVAALLRAYSGNSWFTQSFWPENEARIRRIATDLIREVPPSGTNTRVLDVGCFNGFLSYLLAQLGYQVTATDMVPSEERERLFQAAGIAFAEVNLNDVQPFEALPRAAFSAVVMGEVIEHVLNHPLGLMQSVANLLQPEGVLVLTTPNPATVMNAARVLLNHPTLWGTEEFIHDQKFGPHGMISRAEIHYREYRTPELIGLLERASLRVERMSYLAMGSSHDQSWAKRLLKRAPGLRPLLSTRLLGSTQYVVARRSSNASA